jgi:DNA polymerase III delta prime subunit
MAKEQFLFTERFRPKTIDECILPQRMKDEFNQYVDQGNIPNLFMVGRPGIGKTTVAKALISQINADYMLVNCSLEGNIDTLRNDIRNFATTVSFTGRRKFCILDEIDSTSPLFQPALRTFMEQYSSNCGFILTANNPRKVIEPLHSRTTTVQFKFTTDEKFELIKQIYKRCGEILNAEKVEWEKNALSKIVIKYYPDFRKILNEIQRHKKIDDAALLATEIEENVKHLIGFIKTKDFKEARKWIGENNDIPPNELFSAIYKGCAKHFQPASIAQLVVLLAEYQYKSAFVVDQEINTSAFIAEVMSSCLLK